MELCKCRLPALKKHKRGLEPRLSLLEDCIADIELHAGLEPVFQATLEEQCKLEEALQTCLTALHTALAKLEGCNHDTPVADTKSMLQAADKHIELAAADVTGAHVFLNTHQHVDANIACIMMHSDGSPCRIPPASLKYAREIKGEEEIKAALRTWCKTSLRC